MRESNFSSPAQNKACVCISSAFYDRRAIDAPSPSLPLVNSLTHLSYLTATTPRIREILSLDGGLERLVRILKACAADGPSPVEQSLSELKGKASSMSKGPRRSPFKSFDEYSSRDVDSENEDDDAEDDSMGNAATAESTRQLLPWQVDDPSFTTPTTSTSAPIQSSTRAKHLLYTYTLAFQCVVNIGVRGSETIRTRVVEAGALDVVVNVLQRYLEDVNQRKQLAELAAKEAEEAAAATPVAAAIDLSVSDINLSPLTEPRLARLNEHEALIHSQPPPPYHLAPPNRVSTPDTVVSMDETTAADDNGSSSGQEGDEIMTDAEPRSSQAPSSSTTPSKPPTASSRRQQRAAPESGDVAMQVDSDQRIRSRPSAQAASQATSSTTRAPVSAEGMQYRDEDVLLSLQLLAYLSKYPHVRSVFHSASESINAEHEHIDDDEDDDHCHSQSHASSSKTSYSTADSKLFVPTSGPTLSSNVFSLVEAFTQRPASNDPFTPRHSNEVQYWAGVIMRNACRKDDSRGGIRQCANMQCGVWEKYAREFAKCRRCRKAKYCSKTCQSKAWQFGHRYWCAKAATKETAATSTGQEENATTDRHHHHASSAAHGHHHSEMDTSSSSRRRSRRGENRDEEDDDQEDEEVNARASAGIDLAAAAASAAHARTTLNRIRGITPRGSRHHIDSEDGVTTPPRQRDLIGNGTNANGGFEVSVAGIGMRVGGGPLGIDENEVAHDLLVGGVFGDIGGVTGHAIGALNE